MGRCCWRVFSQHCELLPKSMVPQSLQPCSVYPVGLTSTKKNRARKADPPSVGGKGIEHTRSLSQNGTTSQQVQTEDHHTHECILAVKVTSERESAEARHTPKEKKASSICLILGCTPGSESWPRTHQHTSPHGSLRFNALGIGKP